MLGFGCFCLGRGLRRGRWGAGAYQILAFIDGRVVGAVWAARRQEYEEKKGEGEKLSFHLRLF